MMADTRPQSHTGNYYSKKRFLKGFRSCKKNVQLPKDDDLTDSKYSRILADSNETLPSHRANSTSALYKTEQIFEPRMAQLETLEAKMARIEVSLSTSPRKKKIIAGNGSVTLPICPGSSSTNDQKHQQIIDSDCKSDKCSKDVANELETLKNALERKDQVINDLKDRLNASLSLNQLSTAYLESKQRSGKILSEGEKREVEERLQKVSQDLDRKKWAIKSIKMNLEKLDVTDNIDVRIQQAELEYQLGREELNALALMEEGQNLKARIRECEMHAKQQQKATLFGCVEDGKRFVTSLHRVEIPYDPKSPVFGAKFEDGWDAMRVDWSTEESGLAKGDRLLEINGKLLLGLKSKEDVARLMSVSPNPAQIVVSRKQENKAEFLEKRTAYLQERWEEAQRAGEATRNENMRLTHRISYLEDQVAELAEKIPQSPAVKTPRRCCQSSTSSADAAAVQIFQKGSKMTVVNAAAGDDCPKERPYRRIYDSLETLSTKTEPPVIDRCRHIKEAQKALANYAAYKRFKDDQSSKSLDFDSEPCQQQRRRFRPLPPQKPLRLSLQKGYSLQSVRIMDKNEGNSRFPTNQNHNYRNRSNYEQSN